MGADKAFLRWHGRTLLDHVLERAHELTPRVQIVGDRKKFASYGEAVIEDIYPGCGPLGGIHAALSTTRSPWNLMLAVDLPLLSRALLSYLVTRARETDATVTVPYVGGGLEPLCAVYRPEFAEVAKQSLEAGKNKIDLLFAAVDSISLMSSNLQPPRPSIFIFQPKLRSPAVARHNGRPDGRRYVRLGSIADIPRPPRHVRS